MYFMHFIRTEEEKKREQKIRERLNLEKCHAEANKARKNADRLRNEAQRLEEAGKHSKAVKKASQWKLMNETAKKCEADYEAMKTATEQKEMLTVISESQKTFIDAAKTIKMPDIAEIAANREHLNYELEKITDSVNFVFNDYSGDYDAVDAEGQAALDEIMGVSSDAVPEPSATCTDPTCAVYESPTAYVSVISNRNDRLRELKRNLRAVNE